LDLFARLNLAQRDAVLTIDGPVLVLAGAGSGKTRVITHRIAYLLELGVPPDAIVALSFTNRAAEEMRKRIETMVGTNTAAGLVLGTFHSLGAQMMRQEPHTFGLTSRRFSILDQGDVYGLVRGLLQEYGHHGHGADRRFDIGAIAQRISLWKNEFVVPEVLQRTSAKREEGPDYDAVAAAVYPAYLERVAGLGAVDFDDLVCKIVLALQRDHIARSRWQARFSYLMVDEYQDTNRAQLEFIQALLGPDRNLCVVGDDDQAIYGWRGAKVANILGFDMYFPGAKILKLEENYRSRAPILTLANIVARQNSGRHDKALFTSKDGGQVPVAVVTPDGDQEARWVGRKIRELLTDRVRADEIAVLYRSVVQSRAIEEQLREQGIAYRVLGGQPFFDRKEVKDVLAYLRVLVFPNDELAFRRAVETPPRGIGPKTLDSLATHAAMMSMTLSEAIDHAEALVGVPARQIASLRNFGELLTEARAHARAQRSIASAIRHVLGRIALRTQIEKETGSSEATQARWNGVEALLDGVARFEQRQLGGKPRWHEYLGSVALGSREQESHEQHGELGKITLATLHSAKGLEWDVVFVIGCEDDVLPHRRVSSPRATDAMGGDLEEERRLFYVGITRAREQLFLTRAANRVERGREIARTPSRFLSELPKEVCEAYDVATREEMTAAAMLTMADTFLARFKG